MYFNVSSLLRESSGSARTFDVDEEFAPVDRASPLSVRGTVRLLRTDQGVWVSAGLETTAACTCSRCLRGFGRPIDIVIEEEFFPQTGPVSGVAVQVPQDFEDTFRIDPDNMLDLTEAARQYFTLSLPMKPVCRDGCAGICSTCGADLNTSACVCNSTVRDAAWGPLLELTDIKEGIN